MKFAGENTLHAPVEKVWDALLDPSVLVRTIPGCEQLEATGENEYRMTVNAGVAAIRGTYTGSCVLTDLVPHESLVMKLEGAGAPGTIGATVGVRFSGNTDQTTIAYDADAVVGGMIGGVGQRMLTSVSRRMASEFFGNVDAVLTGPAPAAAPEAPAAPAAPVEGTPTVFTAPPRPAAVTSQADFLKGIAVGAGLVLIGVLIGRRR